MHTNFVSLGRMLAAWRELEAASRNALSETVTNSNANHWLATHLEPIPRMVPDVQDAEACACQLTRSPVAARFRALPLNALLAHLFHSIAANAAAAGLPEVALCRCAAPRLHATLVSGWHWCCAKLVLCQIARHISTPSLSELHHACVPAHVMYLENEACVDVLTNRRFDLFHGHIFWERDSGRLGILFHCKEHPAWHDEHFPYRLGYCQDGSTLQLALQPRAMDFRNVVFFAGRLAALDVSPDSPLHDALLHDGTRPLRTVYESDFGEPAADVNYFAALQRLTPPERVFVCA